MSTIEDDDTPCLVTNYTFDNRDFVVKMFVKTNYLKLCIIDSTTSEKWLCTYNAMYIEELTRRTGNYKKFNVFLSMIKSGILRTSSSVRIELMSHSDLEALSAKNRYKNKDGPGTPRREVDEQDTRKYFILVYTVEFDKIHYPLPLEYCGMPNPKILQKRIQYLEKEKRRLEEELANVYCPKCTTQLPLFQEEIRKLTDENRHLINEVKCLTEFNSCFNTSTQQTMTNDNKYLQEQLQILKHENLQLTKTLELMHKKLKGTNNKLQPSLSPRQLRKCQKCLQLTDNLIKPIKNQSLKLDLKKKVPTPNSAPNRMNTFRKPCDYSSRSSGSESGSESRGKANRKFKKNQFKSKKKLKRNSGSSSAGGEDNYCHFKSNISPPPLAPPTISQHVSAKRYDITDAPSITPEDLKKQISDLVKLVESWSNNYYNYPNI